MRSTTVRFHRGLGASLIAAVVSFACGGGDGSTGNDFTIQLSASPSTLTLQQGTSGQVTITLVRGGGFSDPVSTSLTGLPTGVTASVTPTQLTGNTTSAVVTVTVGASVTPGTYTVTVTGTASGVGSATVTYQLTVTQTPDYTLSASPTTVPANAGGSGATTVTIARTNFAGSVDLSLDTPPAGVTGSFNPASTTGTTSTATINVAASVTPGSYQVTIKGTSTGPGTRTTVITLTVAAAPNYTLSLNPAVLSVPAGGPTDSTTVNITRTNFTGAVTLSLSNPPTGVSGVFAPPSPTGDNSKLTLTVTNAVAPGLHVITIMGTAAGVPTRITGIAGPQGSPASEIASAAGDRTTTLQLTVTAPPSIALVAGPATVQALQGGIASSGVTITRTSFPGAVNLAATGMPAGMTVSFNPNATMAAAAQATVIVGAGVPVGNHVVTVTGSGTGISNATTTLTVQVSAPLAVFNTEQRFAGTGVPEFFAVQNGAGGWQPVLPLYDQASGTYTYRTNMTAGYGGVYYVLDNAGLQAAVQTLYLTGFLGPEDLLGAFEGRRASLITNRLRQAASMSPTFGNAGKLTFQSYGTPTELNALGGYFAPTTTIGVNNFVANGLPITKIWTGGRRGTFDGSLSTVVIPDVTPGRLADGMVASRFNASDILDRVLVKPTAGTANTLDMLGSGSSAPLFTPVSVNLGNAMSGTFSSFWRSGRFVGLVDIQDVTASTTKSVGAPQLSQWGTGGYMGIHTYDTDELTFKRKFTGFESNWNAKNTFVPALLSATTSNTNGYAVNFSAPTEFGLPFRGAAGVLFPADQDGNAIVATATSSYFQLSGQSGPTYQMRYLNPADVGAPASGNLEADNYLLFGVTKSASCLADGLTPLPTLNSVNIQSMRLWTIGYR